MSKARDSIEDLKTIDANLAAKSPLASPTFTGNVGVGVTPKSWLSSYAAVQIGAAGCAIGSNDNSFVSLNGNAYVDSVNSRWEYVNSDFASQYQQYDGQHNWRVAASGTADAAISWNDAMTINNAGIVTKPLQPAFCMSVNAYSGINAAAGVQVVRFGNQNSGGVLFNNGNNFDTTNYRFVAPVSGFYQFNANIRIDTASGDYIYLTMTKNGSTTAGRDLDSGIGSYNNRHVSQVLSLSANDYVDCNVRTSGDTSIGIDGDSYFSGHLIG